MDFTGLIAGGGVLGLFGAAAVLMFRAERSRMQADTERGKRVDSLEAEILLMRTTHHAEVGELNRLNRRCAHQVSILVFACQKAGIAVPEEVWGADE